MALRDMVLREGSFFMAGDCHTGIFTVEGRMAGEREREREGFFLSQDGLERQVSLKGGKDSYPR